MRKGKYRLFEFVLRHCGELPVKVIVNTRDGRKLNVYLSDKMYDTVYFLGEYERSVTAIISKIVEKNDICIDAGANYGWYATLLAQMNVKEVHAFEPVLPTYKKLEENFKLLENKKNIFLNHFALGNETKDIKLHIFENQPNGHASISTMGNTKYIEYDSKMITLDDYLLKNCGKTKAINFIKVDIEGAELLFLQGAKNVFKQTVPPLIIMEMALQTSKHFGYKPNDLLKFINEQTPYEFYTINEYNVNLKKIEKFEDEDIGANVLCVPKNHYRDRLQKLIIE